MSQVTGQDMANKKTYVSNLTKWEVFLVYLIAIQTNNNRDIVLKKSFSGSSQLKQILRSMLFQEGRSTYNYFLLYDLKWDLVHESRN